ncbi:prephenate dehydrogenase/arogenate dehydrogenase family protein [Candidatus Peregrinibacteria bacterium]|nr:prephenate dehydrogenase/arogenate dehydrogenase family protein [Candidatus Peregrinibacteria bacterium]
MTVRQISIIGFGRFGKVLYELLKKDFAIVLYDKKPIAKNAKNIKEIYESDVIFYAIPIEAFETAIKAHKKYFKPEHLLIDVLSVKMHPKKVFKKYLKGSQTQALLTHPMFGPDSARGSFKNLPLILDQFTADKTNYNFWKNYFRKKGLNVIEMTADEHDKLAAKSQGLTHFIGRLLEDFCFKPTPIDSLGAKTLHKVKDQTCNDTWQLFTNLQHFNPYTKQMRIRLGASYDRLYNKLLPRQANPNFITYGIQGGRGSFNEEAVMYYLKRAGKVVPLKRGINCLASPRIKYLYTAENVLRALHKGEIDFGQFAIQNSVGGAVDETISAMAKYKFKITDQFAIKISHALLARSDAKFSDITQIMSHPQALTQCKQTLAEKYGHLKQTSGKKELIDQTVVARQLALKRLPKSLATLGSRVLADIYGLKIIEEALQDAKENYTSFMLVERV